MAVGPARRHAQLEAPDLLGRRCKVGFHPDYMTANKERVRRHVVLSAIPVPRVHWRSRLNTPGQDAESAEPFEELLATWPARLRHSSRSLLAVPLVRGQEEKKYATAWDLFVFGTGTYMHTYIRYRIHVPIHLYAYLFVCMDVV
jgi:hypothetical protein